MELKKTILLGIKNNNIITADVTITDRNNYKEFTASFNVGEAFNVDDIDADYKKDYFEEAWSCFDDEHKLQLLQDGEITKDDVIKDWSYYSDYTEIKDCSCTNYELDYKGITINFETVGCGQYDVRNDSDFEDMIFTDEKLFNDIMYYWDKFHLKEINDEQMEEIKKIMNSKYQEESDAFNEFIINNLDWQVL